VKLVMTLFVRNEEDILEANLDYHLEQGVDFVIATDNRSEDGTREILERYAREGHVRVLSEERDDYRQPEGMTRMARMAAEEHGADWVINNDADEFWWPNPAPLKEVFAAIPPQYGALGASRVNFVARPDDEALFAERMIVSKVREISASRERDAGEGAAGRWFHGTTPKLAHRARRDVEVLDASHGLVGEGLETVPGWRPIDVLHFPQRSYAHFEAKVRNGGPAAERNPDPKFNPYLRTLYDLYERGELPAYYTGETVDDEEVEAGLREGRYLVDRRLQRWFREHGRSPPAAAAGSDAFSERPDLEAEMLRWVTIGEWQELQRTRAERRVGRLEQKLARLEEQLEKVRRAREKDAARASVSEERARPAGGRAGALVKSLRSRSRDRGPEADDSG
jgi:hypothetical protein